MLENIKAFQNFKIICAIVPVTFTATTICPPDALAQLTLSRTPAISTSVYQPAAIQAMTLHPDQPLQFDFLIDAGDSGLSEKELQKETQKLIKYFLASLAVSEKDMWVNLSPYEKDRIVPETFGQTEMGRDLLSQDYLLKQITASLMNPEGEVGKKFWERVYERIYQNMSSPNAFVGDPGSKQNGFPIETFGNDRFQEAIESFNKVWIVPGDIEVFENGDKVFITKAELKVMMEEDYSGNGERGMVDKNNPSTIHQSPSTKEIIRDTILPAIEHEVNHGETFAPLRQIMNSLILASWYKNALKESVLSQAFVNQERISGVLIADPNEKEKIWQAYVDAFKIS